MSNPKGGNQALSIRIRGRSIFNVFLASRETRFSAKMQMFSIELELTSVVANPKGGNQALSIRIRGRCIFNGFLASRETRFSAKMQCFQLN